MTKQIVIGVNPEYDAMREAIEKLQRAFDDQTRELENALSLLTPKQLTEFRRKTYPSIHAAKPKTHDCQECKHHDFSGDKLKCLEGHKPRFFTPRSPVDDNWGWKRRCEDFIEEQAEA